MSAAQTHDANERAVSGRNDVRDMYLEDFVFYIE